MQKQLEILHMYEDVILAESQIWFKIKPPIEILFIYYDFPIEATQLFWDRFYVFMT